VGNCPYRLAGVREKGASCRPSYAKIFDEMDHLKSFLTRHCVYVKPLPECFRKWAVVKRSSRKTLTALSKRPTPLRGMIACYRLYPSISMSRFLLLTNQSYEYLFQSKVFRDVLRNGRNHLYYPLMPIIGLWYSVA
jgi:hypothetical protein